jgi:2-polyprenyl-3-methyl-5-hydroxy-6-metoxy-1,4-benzoquinol methylase
VPPSVLTPKQLSAQAAVGNGEARAAWNSALSRSGEPQWALLSLLDDWVEYSGQTHRELLDRIAHAAGAVKSDWAARPRDTPEAVGEFYDESWTSTPLLLWWHANDPNPARCALAAASLIRAAGGSSVLDFGCGIGSTSLLLARNQLHVTLAEISGDMLDFARWRFDQRHIACQVLDLRSASLAELAPGSLDAVVAFDVFEHIPDATPHLELLDRALAANGVACLNQAYVSKNDPNVAHFPQHGEVLEWLHNRGYRLAHVPSTFWVAQKAPLGPAAHRRQGVELKLRIAAARAADGLHGPARSRLEPHVARLSLR